jgi:FAD-NAD(P)-binding
MSAMWTPWFCVVRLPTMVCMTDESSCASVAIIGAGPTGVSLVERISANAPELLSGRLVLHVIDPHPPGPGRVWRYDQSPLLWMNSMPEDVTMFTDDSVVCDGPIRPGPALAEWVQRARAGDPAIDVPAALAAEIDATTPTTFPTRRLQSAYLDWFFAQVQRQLAPGIETHIHETTVLDILGDHAGRQTVLLANRAEPLVVDHVVLAVGHLDVTPSEAHVVIGDFARENELRYFPPGYTADLDLSAIEPGEEVIVRGFGLAFVDFMALLTEGRGGHFETGAGGRLDYHPSGKEPKLYVGSRRGVPYHAKPEYRLRGTPAQLPRFFGSEQVEQLIARPRRVDFRLDMWPLIAKDIGWGYYTELFTGHPDCVRMDFAEFDRRYAQTDWDSEEMRALVAEAVPGIEDRLDLNALDRPLRGLQFADVEDFAAYLHNYVEADLARRADPRFSADLGAFLALLYMFGQLSRVVAAGRLDPVSQLDDVDGWWFGFFSYFASGPPGPRLRQMLALARAGVLSFLGPDMWVRTDERTRRFVAGSPAVPGSVSATALVEARLPGPSIERSANPLVLALHRRGVLSEEVLPTDGTVLTTGRINVSPEGELVDIAGDAHPRITALGAHTSVRTAGAFARPRTNAMSFRRNDSVARRILGALSGHAENGD